MLKDLHVGTFSVESCLNGVGYMCMSLFFMYFLLCVLLMNSKVLLVCDFILQFFFNSLVVPWIKWEK